MTLNEARRYAQRLRDHELLTVSVAWDPVGRYVLKVLRPAESNVRTLSTRREVQDAMMGRWS